MEEDKKELEININKLNVYQKFSNVRNAFSKIKIEKSGKASLKGKTRAGKDFDYSYEYFEIGDYQNHITSLLFENRLVDTCTFEKSTTEVIYNIINIDNPKEKIVFKTPYVIATTGSNEIQQLGGTITFMRRYIIQLVFNIIVQDEVENGLQIEKDDNPEVVLSKLAKNNNLDEKDLIMIIKNKYNKEDLISLSLKEYNILKSVLQDDEKVKKLKNKITELKNKND